MKESINKTFNHFKVHTQYSICEGALKIEQLKDFCKNNKIKSLGLSDTHNLSGALEFSESLSSVGTQPIIGTQILFKYKDFKGFIPLIAKNLEGYKNIIELSSKSYLENLENTDPFCNFDDLLNSPQGIIILSGSIRCLIGKLFNKGLFDDIENIINKLSISFKDNFYIEIQRHKDLNENEFENFSLNISKKYDLPILASNEVYYLDKSMSEAHDVLMCIGQKTYVNDSSRIKLSDQHYLKTSNEMIELFKDLPEALENNFNLPYRCSFRPLPSKPILPNISTTNVDTNDFLKKESYLGLKEKFANIFKITDNDIDKNTNFIIYKKRLEHEIKIILEMNYAGYFLIVSDYINGPKKKIYL